jgi:hypothetical protein
MVTRNYLKRLTYAFTATLLGAASISTLFLGSAAHAYGLVSARSIQLSTSAASATAVTYKVTFTAATTGTMKGVVIDFCDNSPIIGDDCTTPAGFSVGTPTVGNYNAGMSSAGTWTAASAFTGRTLTLKNTTGVAVTATTTILSFDLTTAANPNTTNHTFYGRILSYANDSGASSPDTYTGAVAPVTNTTGVVDAGGIALSTANQVTVTSKVQERLSFCVYTGANCAAGGSAVTLGDTNGVLDPAGPYVDRNTQYDIATNASQGVAIRVKGTTLTSGSFTITGIGGSAAASAAGSEQFGFCTYETTATTTLTAAAPYNGPNCSSTTQTAGTGSTGGNGTAQFAFDTTNVNTTYGQTFANKTAGSTSSGVIPFIGNISNTTEAGIYTTTLTFIATGIY